MTFAPEYKKINSGERFVLGTQAEIVSFKMNDNLDKGVGNILSKTSIVSVNKAVARDNSVSYEGSIICTVAFVDLEGQYRTMSYQGKIGGEIPNELVTADSKVSVSADVVSTSIDNIAGSKITVTCEYEVSGYAVNESSVDVLERGDGFYIDYVKGDITKRTDVERYLFNINQEEILKCDVSLVLSTFGNATVEKVTIGDDLAIVDGKVYTFITYETVGEDSKIITDCFTLPFREEIDIANADIGDIGTAVIDIDEIKVTAYSDENKNSTKLAINVNCYATVCCYQSDTFNYAVDVFSSNNELLVTRQNLNSFLYIGKTVQQNDEKQIFTLDDNYERVECVISSYCYATNCSYDNNYITCDGVLKTCVLLYGEMGYKLKEFDMPISHSMPYSGNDNTYVTCSIIPTITTAKLRVANELEIFSTLNVNVDIYENKYYAVICDLNLGDEKPTENSAIVIYMANKGDSLMDVAKKLNAMPNVIMEQNPTLSFPLKQDEKVILYRQRLANN